MLDVISMTAVWVGGLSLAAFLVLFWVLRRAPLGQAAEQDDTEEAPRSGYRDRVAAASVFGLVLVAIGAYVALAVSIPWSLPLFALGFGLVITLVSVTRRYRHASPTLRRVAQFSNAALTASLLGGILIVGNVMAFKYGSRAIDFTSERAFSLASQTTNLLKHLDRPVTFTSFITNREASRRVMQLLDLIKAENPGKIRVEAIDPFLEYERAEQLWDRVPDVKVAVQQGGGVAIEYGTEKTAEHVVVQVMELFEIPPVGQRQPDPTRFESTFTGEDALTSALTRLREGKKSVVAFTTGHGEMPTDQIEQSQRGIGLFKTRLTSLGSDAIDLNLLSQDVDPAISLVITAAPRSPFQPEEVERLRNYLTHGGHLLAILGREPKSGLEELLKSYKIEVGSNPIVEPRQHVRGRPFTIGVLLGGISHPIVESLTRQTVIMPNSLPLTVLNSVEGNAASASVVAQPIVRTSNESWAESEPENPRPQRDEKKDQPGPFNIGVAVSDLAQKTSGSASDATPRMVVFSSPDMADNYLALRYPMNLDLLLNAVHWMRGRPELQGIAPKKHVSLTLAIDPQLRLRLILVPSFIAIVTIISAGVCVYMNRRA